jgi:hypothetical protein
MPFQPWIADGPLNTVQLPTTLPTMDELLGRTRDLPGELFAAIRPGLNVFTLHAEVEGGPLLSVFQEFLYRLRRNGVELTCLLEAANQAIESPRGLPIDGVTRGRMNGRSGWVTVQHTRSPVWMA